MNLQEEIYSAAAERLAKDIDAEVMRTVLRESGWHEVVLQWVMTHEQSREVDEWVEQKSKGEYWNCGLVWLFKNETDAMWFKLRWIS